MTMRTVARFFTAAALSLGLLAGCASTGDEEAADMAAQAEAAISDAKAANAKAASMGFEWRDTGDMIKKAEDLMAEGKYEEAIAMARKAEEQGEDAQTQARMQEQKLQSEMISTQQMGSSAGMAGMADSYTVVRGDNLWSISGKDEIYADPYQWPLIYKTNRSKINDPDLIYPGQNFDIDRNASSAEIDAAVNHAKTRGAWSVGDVENSDLEYLDR